MDAQTRNGAALDAAGGLSGAARLPLALWVVDSLRLGGAERLALAMARRPPEGWRIELVALQACGSQLEASARAALGERLRIGGMRRLSDLAEFRQLLREVRRRRPTLLHAHLRYASIWAAEAARRAGIPLVTTRHVMPAERAASKAERMRTRLESWAFHRAQRRIYVSQAQRRAWGASGDTRARVVANGVAATPPWNADQRRAWRRTQGIEAEQPLLATVAVVRAAKGWREWLEAARRLRERHPEAQWVWIGGGEELDAFAAAVRGREEYIRLTGARNDVADWLRGADLFVLPSHGEALPTAVIEAMAQRLPVITTEIAACREALGDGGAAYVRVGAPEEMAQAAADWIEHPEAAQLAARLAEARWRERYSPEAWRARLAEVYEEMAPRANRRGHSLLMVEFFGRGGLDHYSRQLADGLAAAGGEGCKVSLLTGRNAEPGTAAAAGAGAARRRAELWTWNPQARPPLAPRNMLRAWRGVRYAAAWVQVLRRVRRERPDWVLLGDLEHRCDAWFVRRLRLGPARIADIWHNLEPFERNHKRGVVRRAAWRERLARDFDCVFVHGAALAREFEARSGVRAAVIAHGNQDWIARLAGPDPGLGRRFGIPPEACVALLFGTLSAYKGVDVMLEALARIAPERRPMAWIAGMPTAGADVAGWLAMARRLELEPWLRWDRRYVPTAEIAWYFRRADFVVLPYRAASQSGVAHLALTFGKPLIVTASGSLAELVDGNGLVALPGNAAALGEAMEALVRDRALRERMGRRSAELAATRHDWTQIGREVLTALEEPPCQDASPTCDSVSETSPGDFYSGLPPRNG